MRRQLGTRLSASAAPDWPSELRTRPLDWRSVVAWADVDGVWRWREQARILSDGLARHTQRRRTVKQARPSLMSPPARPRKPLEGEIGKAVSQPRNGFGLL